MKFKFHFTNTLFQKMAKLVLNQNSFHKDDKLSDNKWFWNICWTSSVLVVYFVLSVGLTFYQKWCMKEFKYPLIMVTIHFTIKWISCVVIRFLMIIFCNKSDAFITFKSQVSKIAPVGVCSALDIAFSNWGLDFIKITLYTMTKSTSIIFILCFALLFKLEKKSCFLVLIVAMISGGLFMFTYKATNFNLFGFLLVLFASFSSGLRWTLAQLIMQRSELGLKNPVDMLFFVQPWMILTITPFAVVQEGGTILDNWDNLDASKWMPVIAGAFIALAMELSEFLVVVNTSSLTLSIAGIFKEIVILVLAVEWEGNSMTLFNFIGLLLCLGGIICHVIHKAKSTVVNNKLSIYNIDEASARFLPEGSSSSEDETGHEDSSTEVLFSVLNSRDR